MSKSEGDLSEDITYRSNYAIDLDFTVKNQVGAHTLIKYMVDDNSEKLRLIQTTRITKGLASIDEEVDEFVKIQKHVDRVIKEVAFKSVIGPESVDNDTVVMGDGDDII